MLIASMESPSGGNYSGSTTWFTGALTQQAVENSSTLTKGVWSIYVASGWGSTTILAGSSVVATPPLVLIPINGSCGSSYQQCISGSLSLAIPGACGGTSTWSCVDSAGGTPASCNATNPACNSCATRPTYTNATFTIWTPTAVNQSWVLNAWSCGFSCINGYTWPTCSTSPAVNWSCGTSANTCTTGSPTAYTSGSCWWAQTWTCNSPNGGINENCSIAREACPVNCYGEWSRCSTAYGDPTCGTTTYNIITPASNGGQPCSMADWYTMSCGDMGREVYWSTYNCTLPSDPGTLCPSSYMRSYDIYQYQSYWPACNGNLVPWGTPYWYNSVYCLKTCP